MGTTKGGRGIIRESSDKLTPWRNAVVIAARGELDRIGDPAPMDGALTATVTFTFIRPASVKRSKRPHMSIAPDLSKLVRSTEDGLKDAGVIKDDALIVEWLARKCYAGEGPRSLMTAGAVIEVCPLVGWSAPPGRGTVLGWSGLEQLAIEGNM